MKDEFFWIENWFLERFNLEVFLDFGKNLKIKFSTDHFLLLLTVAGVSFCDYLWVSQETRPPHWDMGRHLWTSILYWDVLQDWRHIYRLWTNYYFYPPFRYWAALPFYLIFGKSTPIAIMSNVLFISILAFSIYGIGKELWGRLTGLLAACFILSSPFYAMQFKEFQLDAPLGAMVSFSLYLLFKSNLFSDKKHSIFLGISLGLGMLTKWTFIFSLAFPLFWLMVVGWRKGNVQNILKMTLVALGVSLLWYGNHPRMLLEHLLYNGFEAGYNPPYLSWDCQLFYLETLSSQLYLIPLGMFLTGLIFSFLSREFFEKNKVLIWFVVGNFFLFSFLHKDSRYTMPMLVGVAVLSVFWIGEIQSVVVRRGITLFSIFYFSLTFWVVSFGTDLIPKDISFGPLEVFGQHGYILGPPTKEDWHQEEVMRMISRQPSEDREMIFKGFDSIYFNAWAFYYFSRLYGVKYDPDHPPENPPFILWREKAMPPSPPNYRLLQKFVLPDKSFLFVFKKGLV